MNQQKSLVRIAELLSRFRIATSIQNANAQYDANVITEDVLIPILNIIFSCHLVNANHSENDKRFPALDLLDKAKRIAFQITSTYSLQKVIHTIDGIVKNQYYKQFDTFYVCIITEKQKKYDKSKLEAATKGHFAFTEKNIIDVNDLYQRIASLPYEEISKVENLLEEQFSDIIRKENKIQNDIGELVERMRSNHNDLYIITELDGAYKARQQWLRKKMFLEESLPSISDINQQFSVLTNLKEVNEKIEFYNNIISNLLDKTSN